MSIQEDLHEVGRKHLGISRMNAMKARGFELVAVSTSVDQKNGTWTFKRRSDATVVTAAHDDFPDILKRLDIQ